MSDNSVETYHVYMVVSCYVCNTTHEVGSRVGALAAGWEDIVLQRKDGVYEHTQLCPTHARKTLRYWLARFVAGRGWRVGRVSNWLRPGLSHCQRCATNWAFVEHHTTNYGNDGSGCFPLCEGCWSELTPVARLPFYLQLFDGWRVAAVAGHYEMNAAWYDIETAVLKGL